MRRDPEKLRAWQQRSKRLQSRGWKTIREEEALFAFRVEVACRAGRMCEAHTPACPPYEHHGAHAHHLAPSDRDRGVHLPERAMFVCPPAHEWIHANPAESYANGWLLRDDQSGQALGRWSA